MRIELLPTTAADEPALSRLNQLYAYDFSEILDIDLGEDGLYRGGTPIDTCWSTPWRHAFFVRVDGKLAGFAILDERSRLTGDADVIDVAEFFVMRRYRRAGVGTTAATRAFDLYPRRWEVRQTTGNVAATMFWRRVIGAYTKGRFEEMLLDDERWRGPVQSFDARRR